MTQSSFGSFARMQISCISASVACASAWSGYRPAEHPDHVRIFHHQTGEVVLQPREDEGRKLYPELEDYLAEPPHIGVALHNSARRIT